MKKYFWLSLNNSFYLYLIGYFLLTVRLESLMQLNELFAKKGFEVKLKQLVLMYGIERIF